VHRPRLGELGGGIVDELVHVVGLDGVAVAVARRSGTSWI
jgi:hypothetical protein